MLQMMQTSHWNHALSQRRSLRKRYKFSVPHLGWSFSLFFQFVKGQPCCLLTKERINCYARWRYFVGYCTWLFSIWIYCLFNTAVFVIPDCKTWTGTCFCKWTRQHRKFQSIIVLQWRKQISSSYHGKAVCLPWCMFVFPCCCMVSTRVIKW